MNLVRNKLTHVSDVIRMSSSDVLAAVSVEVVSNSPVGDVCSEVRFALETACRGKHEMD